MSYERVSKLNAEVHLLTSRKIWLKHDVKSLLNGTKKKYRKGKPAAEVFISPGQKQKLIQYLEMPPKKYASRYYQLKVGHGAVGTYLTRIGVIETPECWWCKEVLQSVEHLFTKCRRWRKQRRKLVRELEKKGIPWQIQGERKWVASLLGNEKAVAPLLKFLETTDVGGREGARERELELERINDQAGEDLLD